MFNFEFFVYGHAANDRNQAGKREGFRTLEEAMGDAKKLLDNPAMTDLAVIQRTTTQALVGLLRGEVWPFQPELEAQGLQLDVRRIPDDGTWPFPSLADTRAPQTTTQAVVRKLGSLLGIHRMQKT
jgi:hypothetical protein